MDYVRPIDFAAFKPSEFHSQRIADRSTGIESCTVLFTRVPPGTGTTGGLHIHPADQFYYILAGDMNVQLGAYQYTAGPGMLVWIPAGVPHWNWNAGSKDELHFELIVPAAPAGHALAHRVSVPGLSPAPAPADLAARHVRPLDPSKFAPGRFSTVTMADRTSGSEHCRINIARVPPDTGGPQLHVHTFDQFYFVISGTMRLRIGLEQYAAGPNSLVVLPAGMPHSNWNDGPEVEEHIAVLVPENSPGTPVSIPVKLDPGQ
jgi:mannose-6-phosphate isomerase-like protein (cupin superfamily)